VKNLPIVGKILAILGAFGFFVLVVTGYVTHQMRTIDTGYKNLRGGETAALVGLLRANGALEILRADLGDMVVSTAASGNQTTVAEVSRLRAHMAMFLGQAMTAYPQDAVDMQQLESRGLQLVNGQCGDPGQLTAMAAADGGGATMQTEFLNKCVPQFVALSNNIVSEISRVAGDENTHFSSLTAMTSGTITTTLVLILVGLVLMMLGGFFAARSGISVPVKALQGVMSRLSGGDLQSKVLGAERKDEIGGMARAVQLFKDAGLEKARLEDEAKAVAAQVEAERAANEAARAEATKQQEFVVHSVATGLEKLSSGDLMFRLTSDFGGDYEKLRGDFNTAMEKLQETMQAIATNTQGVRSGAEEITQASDDLSRRTEQQAASLEETAAALDQITATVRRTAEVANEARDLVATSKTDAERSGDVVRQTVGAMDGIESSSKQIANIIGVIDEIAFQTNLLALNAGVEAARAGDAGRGFAVVATEVRALAQRSADAAKEIKSLISASTQQVDVGVKLVSETGNALGRIVTQVTQLNGLVVELAASAKEQATGLDEVNSAVNQMDQVTQQNAAMVEQATAASHGLSSEAQELARLVGQFHIGESAAAPVLKRAAPKTPPKKRVVTASARKVVALPRQDEAKHVALADAQEGWSEF
jgi:methyl-accepting chemotaxis protein